MTEAQRSNRKLWILFLIALVIALLPWIVLAQGTPIEKEKFHINKESEEKVGYTQAVKVGNTIYISGTVGRGPMDEALKKVYTRLEATLKNYGATFQNVVKENLYTTQIDEVVKHQFVRREFYKEDFPASTWVEIKRLYSPEAVLEIELVAVLRE
jgi:2-iminobutanoate/2-iminopropanoate deaminase